MTNICNSRQWSTSPTAYLTLQYEYKRSGTSMLYRFYWKVWLAHSDSYYYDGLQLNLKLDGNVVYSITVKGYNKDETGWSYEGTTDWVTVSSKTSGNTPIAVSLVDTNTHSQKHYFTTALSVIAMASQLWTIGSFDVDSTDFHINTTRNDTSSVDELVISCFDTVVKTISGIKSTTIYPKFTDAEKETIYNLMKDVSSTTFTFKLTSFLADEEIGSDTKTGTGSITNALPTIDGTEVAYYDKDDATLAVTKDEHCIVQSKSDLYVSLPTANGNKCATISKYTIKIGETSVTSNASGEVHFGAIAISGDLEIYVTVTDSRGNETTVTKALSVLTYAPPIITASVTRKNNYEEETYLEVNAVFSPVNEKNSVSVAYQHAKVGEEYPSAVDIINDTEYVLNCSNTDAYNFRITVTDAFGTTVTKEYVLSKGEFPLFIDIEKNAVGINAFPKSGEALRVGNGVSVFEDGIVIGSSTEGSTKMFKITVDDDGQIIATKI